MKKSDAMRRVLEENPNIMPTAAVEVLKSQGFDVTPQSFSTFKTANKKKARKGAGRVKRKPTPAAPAAPAAPSKSSDTFSLADLLLAKQFADEMGGITKAKEVIDALETLLD